MSSNFPIRMLNGVGVVASKKRSINLSNAYDKYFPKPDYHDPILVHNGENEMTIDKFIPKIVREYAGDTQKISELLKKDTIEGTSKAIFNFVYKNIQYTPDSPHEEQIRRPARTWADRVRGVDCDCYTAFISSILYNLRIPHYLRMAAYNASRGYQHIYVIVPKNPEQLKGDYYTIDPVLDSFNQEKKPFIKVHDKLIQPINALSVGVNGFPIRMLNGGMDLRSPLVYDQVLYSPYLDTWALKGIDGGYYIEGDYNRRYVEPLDGVGVGWLSTALNVGKKIFKGGKKLVKRIRDRRAARKELQEENPELSRREARQMAKEQTSQKRQAAEEKISRMKSGMTDELESRNSDASIRQNMKDTDDSILKEFSSSQADLDKKLQSLNNSTILSLKSLDKGTKEKFNEVVSQISPEIKKLFEEGASARELAQKTIETTKAALMNTTTLNKKEEDRKNDIVNTVENTAREQKEAISKQAVSQKIILIAVGALALVVVFSMFRGNKQ